MPFIGRGPEDVDHIPGSLCQVDLPGIGPQISLIQLGDPDDVVDQGDEPLALAVDVAGELDHGRLVAETAAHELSKAADRGEGGLELVGDIGGKFPPHAFLLPGLGLHRLPADLLLLHGLAGDDLALLQHALHQGLELRVGGRVRQVLQLHLVDGAGDALRDAEGGGGRDQQDQEDDPESRTDRQKGGPDCAQGPGEPQDSPVFTPEGIVHHLRAAGCRAADDLSGARLQCLPDLPVLRLVGDALRVFAVVENLAVRIDPGDPVCIVETLQVTDPADLESAGRIGRLRLQGCVGLIEPPAQKRGERFFVSF